MWLIWVSFPEVFPLSSLAEIEGAEMANGVGAVFAPAHAAPFEPIGDHRFAGALDGAGADLPAVGDISGIIHAMLMILKVTQAVGMR